MEIAPSQTPIIKMKVRGGASSKNLGGGGQLVIGWTKSVSLVRIGLTDLPKIPPLPASLQVTIVNFF